MGNTVIYNGDIVGVEFDEPSLEESDNIWFSVNSEDFADDPEVPQWQFNRMDNKAGTLKSIDEALKLYQKIINELLEARVKVEALPEAKK